MTRRVCHAHDLVWLAAGARLRPKMARGGEPGVSFDEPANMCSRLPLPWLLAGACVAAVVGWTAVVPLRAQRQGPEIATGTNVLLGRVVDTGTGAPVAGAVVTLTGHFDASGRALASLPRSFEPGASPPRSVLTNGDGYFLFRDLPAGRYSVAALAFGYLSRPYPLRIIEISDSGKPTIASVPLAKYATISGTVMDERGDPIVGAPVTVLHRVMIGGQALLRQAYVEALTDDRGAYRLAQLEPGRYVVGVLSSPTTIPAALAAEFAAAVSNQQATTAIRRGLIPSGAMITNAEGTRIGDSVLQLTGPTPPPGPGGSVLSFVTTFFPGTSVAEDATVIAVESGEERSGVDLALRLSPAFRVSGVVTGPSGPIANLAVRLIPPNAADTRDSRPTGVNTALTDSNGAFTFLAVTPGSYTLRAYLVVVTESDPTTKEQSLWAVQPLTVGDSDVNGVTVTMRPGIRVSGRMEFRGSRSGRPEPQQGTRVHLQPIGAQSWRPGWGIPTADWTFTTLGDPPGRYIVNASIQGWTLESISRGGTRLADDLIELTDADISGLVFTYTDRPSHVSGTVVDAKGGADAGSDVIVFPADTTPWREGIFNSRRARMMHATSTGAFEFTGLPAGDYYVVAVSERPASDWHDRPLDRLIGGATTLTVTEGGTHTLQLKTSTPRGR